MRAFCYLIFINNIAKFPGMIKTDNPMMFLPSMQPN